ncbi:MAG TPA: response regulator [Thermodesulfobacteriota bacterium]|nr:response regulator [Thermodesulfobacteriota bacterium]
MGEKSTKVLLVEDDISYAQLVQMTLSRAREALFDVERKGSLSEALNRLREGDIDLVLLDLNLPDSGGIETFFRMSAKAQDIPVILLTGTEDEALALKAVQMGAQAYLVKGEVNGKHLVHSILSVIERHSK